VRTTVAHRVVFLDCREFKISDSLSNRVWMQVAPYTITGIPTFVHPLQMFQELEIGLLVEWAQNK
jgi:hypothetical protein